MNFIVLSAMLPVVGLIAIGILVGRSGWLKTRAVALLSAVAFNLLTPALLFRTMSTVHVEQLDLRPGAAYVLALALVFAATLVSRGMNRRSAVLALALTYSNAVMIGIPLVRLAYGEAGLVTLLTLIPVHSLLLLTAATVALEFALAHERAAGTPAAGRLLLVAGRALRKALLHPVPLPIIGGLLFAQTGWLLPVSIDVVLLWLGRAFSPLALVLVGVTLARSAIGALWRDALVLVGIKNLVVPVLAGLLGWAFGMRGLPLTVMVVTASLPMGANVFVFSNRYGVAQDLITASVALSTLVAVVTVSLAMLVTA